MYRALLLSEQSVPARIRSLVGEGRRAIGYNLRRGPGQSRGQSFPVIKDLDTTGRTQLKLESWLSGLGALIAFRKAATQSCNLPED
jgi:hypothetical protein